MVGNKASVKTSQKWTEEQAQSLIDKTTAAFQQGKLDTSYSTLLLLLQGDVPTSPQPSGSPRPRMMPAPHMGGPFHDASSWDGASGTCSWNEAAQGRAHAKDAWAPKNEMGSTHPLTAPARPGMTGPDR